MRVRYLMPSEIRRLLSALMLAALVLASLGVLVHQIVGLDGHGPHGSQAREDLRPSQGN